jgi:signal transduction histidine kinase
MSNQPKNKKEPLVVRRWRWTTYLVSGYLFAALLWWAVLLGSKNEELFEDRAILYQLSNIKDYPDMKVFKASKEYAELRKKYVRQKSMIIGEAMVFLISLIVGFYLINRAFKKEIEAEKYLRNFLLSITHELKSPITGAKLALETIKKRQLNPEQISYVTGNGLKEMDRLYNLVDNMLMATRMEQGYQPLEEMVDISFEIEKIVQQMKLVFPDAEFKFFKKNIDPEIKGDRISLISMFVNLIENSLKYSPEGRRKITIEFNENKEGLGIQIADQGLGIPEDESSKVFQKFYRIGNEDTRETKGTGLGLYIVERTVNYHNGKIKILPNKPNGTIFQIFIPIRRVNIKKSILSTV